MTKLVSKRVVFYARVIVASLPVAVATAWAATLPACEYEDSQNCYWNAAREGNGHGQSFINLGFENGPAITLYGVYHDRG